MNKKFSELKEGDIIYQLSFDKDKTLQPVIFQKIDIHKKFFRLYFYRHPIDCSATISNKFLNKDTSMNFSLTTEERTRDDMRINYLSHSYKIENEYHRKKLCDE